MVYTGRSSVLLTVLALLSSIPASRSQSYSTCNPLTQGTCPADPALSQSISIDFTAGASNEFTSSGSPLYGSNGAQFTIAKSGDSPTISSKWYIMFGHVEFVLKAAPGTGIVSSAILQSDDLDEIDFEWLGGDDNQVQSNYFGKGQTVTGYNRGAFHGAQGNHDQFHTYTIDWTKDQIVWQVDGTTVRVLTPATAETNQYPQTPMMIKVGVWAGGDPANPAGTVEWAGGQTDYTQGPFSMYLKSMKVQDYSTGTSYSYSGTTGSWDSIQANGGTIYTGSGGKDTPAVGTTPAVKTATGAPVPLTTDAAASSVYATRTGYPWIVATASIITTTSQAPYTTIAGLPPGWSISNSGKVVPPSSGATTYLSTSFSQDSASESSLASEVEVKTTYDQQGFPTLTTITTAIAGESKAYGDLSSVSPSSGISIFPSTSITASATFNTPRVSQVTITTVVTIQAPGDTGVPRAVSANSATDRKGSDISIVAAAVIFVLTIF